MHNGYKGVMVDGSNVTLVSNNIFANASTGLDMNNGTSITATSNISYANGAEGVGINTGGSFDTLANNNVFSNSTEGFNILASNIILTGNNVYNNTNNGMLLSSNGGHTVNSNNVYANGGAGLYVSGNNDSFVANNIYANSGFGVDLIGSNNVFIANSIYSNTSGGLEMDTNGTGNLCASCNIGYSSTSVSSPDTTMEISLDNANTENLTLKNSLVNPSPGIDTTKFAKANSYLLNYSTNSGVLQVYGDYLVSGSTLTLDYTSRLYTSTGTNMKVMIGAETASNFTVNATSDTNAVSQLITMTYVGATWSSRAPRPQELSTLPTAPPGIGRLPAAPR